MGAKMEIRLSGSGGQGLVLGGVILAEAAAVYDDKNAVQSQSYGPEARGGASKSDVIISDEDIEYPKASHIDALLALSQEACDKYTPELSEGGLLLVDADMVTIVPAGNFQVVRLPFTSTARNRLGKPFVVNIIALGSLVELTGCVSARALEEAVLTRVPRGTEEINRKALELGRELAREASKKEGK